MTARVAGYQLIAFGVKLRRARFADSQTSVGA